MHFQIWIVFIDGYRLYNLVINIAKDFKWPFLHRYGICYHCVFWIKLTVIWNMSTCNRVDYETLMQLTKSEMHNAMIMGNRNQLRMGLFTLCNNPFCQQVLGTKFPKLSLRWISCSTKGEKGDLLKTIVSDMNSMWARHNVYNLNDRFDDHY